MAVAASLAIAVAIPIALRRGDAVLGASPALVQRVGEVADGRVVLAPAPLSESLAVAGVRVWMSNPLDAFSKVDQAAYLDFLAGKDARRAIEQSDVVVVQSGSAAENVITSRFALAPQECGDGWTCYVRS